MAVTYRHLNLIVLISAAVICFLQPSYQKKIGPGTLLCAFEQATYFLESELHLCSHATIYNFVKVLCDRGQGITFCHPSQDDTGFYKTLGMLKAHFPTTLGIRFAVGDINESYISDRLERLKFAKILVDFMTEHGLTFVEFADSDLADSENKDEIKNFKLLMEELAKLVHSRDLLVGMSTSDPPKMFGSKYPDDIFEYLDWFTFNLPVVYNSSRDDPDVYMTPSAPVEITQYENRTTKHWIELWLERVKPEDFLLGMVNAGLQFSAKERGVEPGPGSKATGVPDLLDFSEICRKLLIDNCRTHWNNESLTPWTACGDDYYTYDDERSLKLKLDIAKSYNVTGLAYWHHDFKYACGELAGPYTYLRALQGIRNISSEVKQQECIQHEC